MFPAILFHFLPKPIGTCNTWEWLMVITVMYYSMWFGKMQNKEKHKKKPENHNASMRAVI